MTHEQDPPRLLQTRDADLSQLLPGLQRARAQGPSEEQLARICAGVATRATPPAPAASEAGAPSASGARATSGSTGAGAAKLVKLLVIGALVAGAAFFALRQAQRRVPAGGSTAVAAPGAVVREAVRPAAEPTPAVLVPQLPAQPAANAHVHPAQSSKLRLAGSAMAGSAAPRRAAQPTRTGSDDVDAELALLERARAEVRPNPARALALTAEHAQRFAHGTLAEEREVIAIEALLVRGRAAAAQARARRFFTDYPASAHGRRVRALLAEHDSALSDEDPQPPPHPSH
jgi:hypothetical protein